MAPWCPRTSVGQDVDPKQYLPVLAFWTGQEYDLDPSADQGHGSKCAKTPKRHMYMSSGFSMYNMKRILADPLLGLAPSTTEIYFICTDSLSLSPPQRL